MRLTSSCRIVLLLAALVIAVVPGCTVEDREAGSPVLYGSTGGTGGGVAPPRVPRVAMDGHGAGMAVWEQDGDVHAKRYVADTGWEADEVVATGGAEEVSVAMFGVGDAVIIYKWGNRILALRFSPLSGWDALPTVLDEGADGVLNPRVATSTVGGSGVVHAVWRKVLTASDGFTKFSAGMADRYVLSAWEGARRIDPQSEVPIYDLRVATGGIAAYAVWSSTVRFDHDISGAWCHGGVWGPPRLLGRSANLTGSPDVGVDSGDNVYAVWQHEDDNTHETDIRWVRYEQRTGVWGTSGPLDLAPEAAYAPRVALNGDGRGVVTWGTLNTGVLARLVEPGTGLPDRIDVDAGGSIGNGGAVARAIPGIDAVGNARVIWSANRAVYACRFDAGGGAWEHAQQIDPGGSNPDLAMDASGRAIAVWWNGGFRERVWEPDEGEILFSTDRDGDTEIFSVRPDGFNPVRHTDNSGEDFDPVWSPDRSRIAYLSDQDGQPSGYQDLYVTVIATGTTTRLTRFAADFGTVLDPAWSPNGDRIAVAWSAGSGPSAPGGIALYDPDLQTDEFLSNTQAGDRWPTWSPAGSQIAFGRSGGIWVIDLQTPPRLPQERLGTGAGAESPAWSPDGNRIAYAARGSSDTGIHVLDLGTSLTTRLTTPNDDAPAWSPDGRNLAFVRITVNGPRIFRMTEFGGTPTEIPDQLAESAAPDWK